MKRRTRPWGLGGTMVFLILNLSLPGLGCRRDPAGGGGAGGARGPGAVQVVVVPTRQEPVREVVPLIGTVAPNEIIDVRSETEGVVASIHFEEGDSVRSGDLLVSLDDSKASAGLAEAEANLRLSEANYDRAAGLLRDRLISEQEFDQAAANFRALEATVNLRRRLLQDTRIHAPFEGIIGARRISPGQVTDRNTVITTLVDLRPMRVEIRVPERYLGQIRVGQTVRFSVDAYPDRRFEGDVYFISPELDPATRTALIKAMVPNPDLMLRAGMFAKLELTVTLRDSAWVIPEPALVSVGDQFTVFVVGPETNAVVRPVRVGIRMAGRAEVLSGVGEGDLVVVEGVQKLYPGAPLRLAGPERSQIYMPLAE